MLSVTGSLVQILLRDKEVNSPELLPVMSLVIRWKYQMQLTLNEFYCCCVDPSLPNRGQQSCVQWTWLEVTGLITDTTGHPEGSKPELVTMREWDICSYIYWVNIWSFNIMEKSQHMLSKNAIVHELILYTPVGPIQYCNGTVGTIPVPGRPGLCVLCRLAMASKTMDKEWVSL